MIDFSLKSERAASLFFISTVSTVSHLRPDSAVPEAPCSVLTTALGGYGSSKQVCELILQDASERSGMEVVICRVGQIAGPVLSGEKGMWTKQEWIPTVCCPHTRRRKHCPNVSLHIDHCQFQIPWRATFDLGFHGSSRLDSSRYTQ